MDPIRLIDADEKSHISALSYSADGSTLFSSGFDTTIKVWDTETWSHEFTLHGHENCANDFAFPPAKDQIMSASSDGTVRLWSTNSESQLHCHRAHARPVVGLRFAPGNAYYATSSYDGSIKFWEWDTHKELGKIEGKKREIGHIVFLGNTILTGGIGDTISTWSVPDGKMIDEYAFPGGGAAFMRLVSGGLVTIGFDAVCRIWDTESMSVVSTFPVADGGHLSSCIDGDETTLACSAPNQLALYTLMSGVEICRLTAKPKSLSCPTFSPDRSHIAAGAADRKIRIWDLSSL